MVLWKKLSLVIHTTLGSSSSYTLVDRWYRFPKSLIYLSLKKAEPWRIDAFELWCWRRLLRVPWTARRSTLGVLGKNDAKAETPVLWTPHAKSWLIGKDSDAGRDWGQEEKGMTEDEMAGWHHWLDGCESWVNSWRWWWTGRPGVLQFMGWQRSGHNWVTELNWTEGVVGGSDGKESTCNVGDLGLIPELGRSPGGGQGNPLQYSCLENPMDRDAQWATVHRVAKCRTLLKWLSTAYLSKAERGK